MKRALGRAPGAVLLAFLALPVLSLFVSEGPSSLRSGLANPLVRPALGLSLVTSLVATLLAIVLGTPLALSLSRGGRGRSVLESLVQLPMVLPPAVAGLGLLLAFGRHGLVGRHLAPLGIVFSFRTEAVVLAQLFVAAPFYVLAAASALRALDPDLVVVARSLGLSRARAIASVAIPEVLPALLVGAATTFARALGEFGATLVFAGNLPGATQTMPLAIYVALESDPRAAIALAVVLAVVALVLLLLLSLLRSRIEGARRG